MNIFVTDSCPFESAQILDDKRVVKMVLETAQILSTVIHKYDPDYHASAGLYKPTHQNHPCVIWTAEHPNHFQWLYEHFFGLCSEYTRRYGKEHKSELLMPMFTKFCPDDEYETPKYFVNCARNKSLGIDYTHINPVELAYRLYLNDRWDTDKREPTWYRRAL